MQFSRPQQCLADVFADSQDGALHEHPDAQGLNPVGDPKSWRVGARFNPYTPKNVPPTGWTHLLGWGQAFYIGRAAKPAPLFVRHLRLWVVGDAGWQLLADSRPDGEVFEPTYTQAGVQGTRMKTPFNTLGIKWPLGLAFHFWGARRPLPAGFRGALVLCDARSKGEHVIGMAADFYKDGTTIPKQGDYSVNCDIGIGRLRRVGSEWRTFGWTSASEADLRAL